MNLKSGAGINEFQQLLEWLDSNPEIAGAKYERIRQGLIKIFYARRCHLAEELADETIERVTLQAARLRESYQGDPIAYFYAVARNVYLEYTRRPKFEDLTQSLPAENIEQKPDKSPDCLSDCFDKLELPERVLIKDYYQLKDRNSSRSQLMKSHNITLENLRVKIFRIRRRLRDCLERCRAAEA